jgi:hypothetical protein
MNLRSLLLPALLLAAAPACVVHTLEPGAVTSNGSVYLGFSLFDDKGKPDREKYAVGQQLGQFSSLQLVADHAVTVSKVVVIFADGERFTAPAPRRLGAGQSSPLIALPRGPRAIHSVVIAAQSDHKLLSKIEVYGNH